MKNSLEGINSRVDEARGSNQQFRGKDHRKQPSRGTKRKKEFLKMMEV